MLRQEMAQHTLQMIFEIEGNPLGLMSSGIRRMLSRMLERGSPVHLSIRR
jgi:hypothetical protein